MKTVKIIELDQEREVNNAYSSGYSEGRIQGQIYLFCLITLLIILLYVTPFKTIIDFLFLLKDWLIDMGFLLIKIVKFIIDLISRINITIV